MTDDLGSWADTIYGGVVVLCLLLLLLVYCCKWCKNQKIRNAEREAQAIRMEQERQRIREQQRAFPRTDAPPAYPQHPVQNGKC